MAVEFLIRLRKSSRVPPNAESELVTESMLWSHQTLRERHLQLFDQHSKLSARIEAHLQSRSDLQLAELASKLFEYPRSLSH
jgi:hypothetical protein